ncbi:hypothetical protein [Rhodococcus phenolicus]|uniref:hypothetical protein n=1 Tax=Rhodococcus phenolicus TaxID=263849 RepID=UPI0012E7FE72|nr:hypothetical protein [Rhodococcus phenolicus]
MGEGWGRFVKVGRSVQKALDEWIADDVESAMLHACNAVDGTAKKAYPSLGVTARFKTFIRDNYDVFGRMGMPGIDPENTRFAVRHNGERWKMDIADVVYHIHRCTHGHGDELPDGFELVRYDPNSGLPNRLIGENGSIRLSTSVIFGLLVVAITDPSNADQSIPLDYFLLLEHMKFFVHDWWGQRDEFRVALADAAEIPIVTLNFGDWTDGLRQIR